MSPELQLAVVGLIGAFSTLIAASKGFFRIEVHIEAGIRRNGRSARSDDNTD